MNRAKSTTLKMVVCLLVFFGITLPETNSLHLNHWGWKMSFLLGFGLFSGAFAVSFGEGN